MAVKSQTLLSRLSEKVRGDVEKTEAQIDAWLTKEYAGGTAHPYVDGYVCDAARVELTRRYIVAGWLMKWGDDQRDGQWVSLEPTGAGLNAERELSR